jgi:lipid A disaccharide synthetase
VSGSVSLELLAARVPAVIVYRIGAFAYAVQSFFRHARFITLVNLLAVEHPILPVRRRLVPPRAVEPCDPEAVYPEYLCVQDPAAAVATHVVEWLTVPESLRLVRERIERIAAAVAVPGAGRRAAEAVLETARSGGLTRAGAARRTGRERRSAA